MSVNSGGRYTKHFYAGAQRIVSKVGDVTSYGSDPRTLQVAGGASAAGITVDYQAKKAALEKVLAERFEELAVPYSGEDNDNYVEGDPKLNAGATAADGGDDTVWSQFEAGEYEGRQYFYHPDHLGSTGYVTDADGQVVQHVEYVPFGEVFIDRRATEWNSPYLFNAKELDEETGLYYYGARYYDPRLSIWLSPDPLAEKYPDLSPYCYTANNPLNYVDPDGKKVKVASPDGLQLISYTLNPQDRKYLRLDKSGYIDRRLLNSGVRKSKTGSFNLICLSELVNDPSTVNFYGRSTGYDYIDYKTDAVFHV